MKGNSFYLFRRWWERHGMQALGVGLALGVAGLIRQTQGAFVFDLYQKLASPFAVSPARQEELKTARIQELEQRLVELDYQYQLVHKLSEEGKKSQKTPIFAPVIGRSAHHWWQQVTLGRGRQDGVKDGDIVTAPGGLVGRVASVSDRTSRVLLMSDPTSRVGVTIGRSRSMGFLRGQDAKQGAIEFFDKVPDVKPGDLVFTSAFSQLFPSGTPVGRVITVNLNASPAPEATVEFSAALNSLEWTSIYPKPNIPNAESELSSKSNDEGSNNEGLSER
jgi:rod shape-determining protein MreC